MPLPLLLSTWSFGKRGNDAAWSALNAGGSGLNAVEKACCVVEADPEVDSVGYGGLPDRDGNVSLDGCVMLAPNRCGGVCNVRHHLHVVSIARKVMETTPHVMLAGDQADEFADACGFARMELLSPSAKSAWEQWKREPTTIDQSRDRGYVAPRPVEAGDGARLFGNRGSKREAASGEARWKHHDTIGVLAIDSRGELAGACSTSGMPYKVPGRVGDSPIIGHGLYVDPSAGAAVATGAGELVMGVCGSFLAVELMRGGATPENAVRGVLQRIIDNYELREHHQVGLIALTPDGKWAAGALRNGFKVSVASVSGSDVVDAPVVMMCS